MTKVNDGGSRRRDPGDITVAALLAAGSLMENRRSRLAESRRGHRSWLAAIPVLLVNTVAFLGQLTYWHRYLPARPEQYLVAVTLESVAIYLAWQAHLARLAHDSALRLQLASYLVAAGVGALNYSHFCHPGWRPTVAAATFGGASAISPWLWGVHSRRASRDDLKARGLIEPHAVRLGATRWFWHAYRCSLVMWQATWTGETRPREAIALLGTGYHQSSREAGGSGPAITAGKPPPDPGNAREPRRAVSVRAARAPELAAASATEAAIALELATSGQPLPSARKLAGTDPRLSGALSTRRRAADRILQLARAHGNGHDVA